MERKEDMHTREYINRGSQGQSPDDAHEINHNDDVVGNESEKIKNASAAGLGAIGRNDQEQTGHTSDPSSNANDE